MNEPQNYSTEFLERLVSMGKAELLDPDEADTVIVSYEPPNEEELERSILESIERSRRPYEDDEDDPC